MKKTHTAFFCLFLLLLPLGAGCDGWKTSASKESKENVPTQTTIPKPAESTSVMKPALEKPPATSVLQADTSVAGTAIPVTYSVTDSAEELPDFGRDFSSERSTVFENAAAAGAAARTGGGTPTFNTRPAPTVYDVTSTMADPSRISSHDTGFITLIEDVEVPAQEAGQLVELLVREGESVERDMLLAKVDDEQAKMAVAVSEANLRSALRKASNDVNIRYAKAARDVADAELLRNQETNDKVKGSVPQTEINRLKLSVTQAELQIEQATHDFEVAQNEVDIKKTELAAARLGVKRRLIVAPVDGIVVERFRHQGEWVKPGDPLLRLIRMDVVRIKFTLDARQVSMANVRGRNVEVKVPLLPGQTFQGKVTFVNPVIESGIRYQVWAEIENRRADGMWMLQPGMPAEAEVK